MRSRCADAEGVVKVTAGDIRISLGTSTAQQRIVWVRA